MDLEECERLLVDLEEAKGSFDILISNMKDEGIDYPYEKLEALVAKSVANIEKYISTATTDSAEYGQLYDDNKILLRKMKAIKGIRVLILVVWIHINYCIAQKIPYMAAKITFYAISNFIALFGTEIEIDNFEKRLLDAKEGNDEVYKRVTKLEDNIKENRKEADNDIDTIRSINRNLWEELKQPRVLSFRRKERVENELKG